MKKKEVYLLNVLIATVLLMATYYVIFRNNSVNEIISIVKKANAIYLVIAVFVMFLYFLIESYNLKCLIKSLNSFISLKNALKSRFISFFFSAITPAATGGEPMQVYSMTRSGVSFSKATLASLINICSFQIVIISLAIICFILNVSILPSSVILLFVIGILFNASALTIMMILIFNKKLSKSLVNLYIKVLKRFKVKNIDEKIDKVNVELDKYNKYSSYIRNHKKEFIYSILRTLVQMSLYYIIPYLVYRSFGFETYNVLFFLQVQAILFASVSSVPLPGSIGISETAYLILYKDIYNIAYLKSSLLLTRGISFYLFLALSLIITLIVLLNPKKKE